MLKISIVVETIDSYHAKKSVRSTPSNSWDTAIWNFAKCQNFTGRPVIANWTSSKSSSEKHVCNTQWKRMGSRRWNMGLIFHTVVLIVVSDMYLEKKYVLTILNPSTTPNAAVGSKFSLRDLLISKFSKSRYCSRVDLKQLHALKNYFQIHYTYYTWLASWSRVVARCPATVLWPSSVFRQVYWTSRSS